MLYNIHMMEHMILYRLVLILIPANACISIRNFLLYLALLAPVLGCTFTTQAAMAGVDHAHSISLPPSSHRTRSGPVPLASSLAQCLVL